MFIVELDSVLMLLEDSTDDELFTGRTPPRWLLAVVDFIDDELATSLLLDSTEDSLLGASLELFAELLIKLELFLLLLEAFTLELDFLLDELLMFELFLLLLEILLELEAFFDEVLLDDLIIELFLLEASLELFAELLIELDLTLELEAFFDEALLDDLIIELFLLDALLELFTELLIELDLTLELFKLELFTGRLPPR